MKATLKKAFILILAAALLCLFALPCSAAAKKGCISVTLEDNQNNKVNGIEVFACRVAELNNSGFYPTADFEDSGISIAGIVNSPDKAAAQSIVDYMESNRLEALSAVSANGTATFEDLELGIWVVFCGKGGEYTFNPYIVFLPFEANGKLVYEVSSAPKFEDNKPLTTNILVVKKWDDKNNAAKKRPAAVTIYLLDGETVVSTAELSEATGWSHTFTEVANDGVYSVAERAVANYKADYSGDAENGFIVTNTYSGGKLPQTGQYWWPIILIAVAGAGFIALGIYEVGVKKNAKKK